MPDHIADQLVFGYRDGHELLAASSVVSHATATELLPHVDASFEDGGEHYLVGTPLETVDRYLLARLWPAAEVQRPGAVWAHALLLEAPALQHASAWLSALRRPDFQALSEFESRVPVPAEPASAEPVNQRLAEGIAWAALGAPEEPSVVVWTHAEQAEPALAAFLEALPEAARQNFSFRTRGRARLGTARYVMQVASQVSGRPKGPVLRVLDLRRELQTEPPAWTHLALPDSAGSSLRLFLKRFAGSEARTRLQVASLAQTWSALASAESPDAVLAALFRGFPASHDAADLRSELLGRGDRPEKLWSVPEPRRLELLMRHPDRFDLQGLSWAERIRMLWDREPTVAAGLAEQHPDFLAAAVEAGLPVISPDAVPALLDHRAVVDQVLAGRPELLEHAEAWPADTDVALDLLREHFAALQATQVLCELVSSDRDDLTVALLDANLLSADRVIEALLANPDETTIARALQVVGQDRFGNWLGTAVPSREAEAALLSFAPIEVLAARDIRNWVPTVENHRPGDPRRLRSAAALLALAIDAQGSDADRILRAVFAPVHLGLMQRLVDDDTWQLLAGRLPNPSSSDRAARLRTAVARRAKQGRWSNQQLTVMLEGAGGDRSRFVDLLPRKHPLRRALDAAVNEISNFVK